MIIKTFKIDDIFPYENNPRVNDAAVDYVAKSIEEFGFKVPIIIDKDHVIAAGHTRLKAAEKLGLSEVPCIVADDLTPEQVKAFRIADNKVNEFSHWDNEKLANELLELQNVDFDMVQFGFQVENFEMQQVTAGGDNEEINLDEFDDDSYECTCPACGFGFNEKD